LVTDNGVRVRLKRLWARWTVIAHAIGNFQARVLLTLFYFAIVPPFALIVKLAKDPLRLRPPRGESFWIARPPADPAEAGRRQF
jgi:hypothetical protein